MEAHHLLTSILYKRSILDQMSVQDSLISWLELVDLGYTTHAPLTVRMDKCVLEDIAMHPTTLETSMLGHQMGTVTEVVYTTPTDVPSSPVVVHLLMRPFSMGAQQH